MRMEYETTTWVDVDPITGKLLNTENGPAFGDEINLIDPGFNSGWRKTQAIWTVSKDEMKGNLSSKLRY
jgi:aldose sugar dehydrogenase